MRTYVFLDVDGVINSLSSDAPGQMTGWGEWDAVGVSPTGEGHGYRILFSRELLRRLETLASNPNVEMWWLTTWREAAAKHLSPAIGLLGHEWPVLPDDGHGDWWKQTALRKFWESEDRTDQTFVWLDDDLKYVPSAVAWTEQMGGLGISPDSLLGLTRRNMESVEGFIDALVVP